MEIRQLEYFLAIAEKGSLAAAAEVIGMAQPSLSVQLKALERRLSTELFVRSARGVTLTAAGALLVGHAQGILAAVARAKDEVRQAGALPAGKVVFGFPSSVSMALSVPLAETVRLECPNIRLRAVDAMSGFIKDWLEEKTVDLAMLYDTTGLRNAEVRTLLDEDMYFYAAADAWPLDTPPGDPVRLQDLGRLDLVLPSRSHGLRALIERAARAQGVELSVVIEMDSLPQIKSLVARGSAFTILAPAAASDYEQRGELVGALIVDPVISRPVHLVRNHEHPRTRACFEVERITVDIVRELVARNLWRGRLREQG